MSASAILCEYAENLIEKLRTDFDVVKMEGTPSDVHHWQIRKRRNGAPTSFLIGTWICIVYNRPDCFSHLGVKFDNFLYSHSSECIREFEVADPECHDKIIDLIMEFCNNPVNILGAR